MDVEVTDISPNGIWLLCGDRALFLSFDDFPWFKDAPVAKILNVEACSPDHFRWPDLDVDLGPKTIEHPERYPLLAQMGSMIRTDFDVSPNSRCATHEAVPTTARR